MNTPTSGNPAPRKRLTRLRQLPRLFFRLIWRTLRFTYKWLCLLIPVALLLLTAYILWTNHRGQQAYEAFGQQLQAAGLPTSRSEWHQQYTPGYVPIQYDPEYGHPLESSLNAQLPENRYLLDAAVAFDDGIPRSLKNQLPYWGMDDPGLAEAIHPDIQQALNAVELNLVSAQNLVTQSREAGYQRVALNLIDPIKSIEDMAMLGRLRHLQYVTAIQHEANNDADSLLDVWRNLLYLSEVTSQQPTLIAQQVSYANDSVMAITIELSMSRMTLPLEELVSFRDDLLVYLLSSSRANSLWRGIEYDIAAAYEDHDDIFRLHRKSISRFDRIAQYPDWLAETFDESAWDRLKLGATYAWLSVCPGAYQIDEIERLQTWTHLMKEYRHPDISPSVPWMRDKASEINQDDEQELRDFFDAYMRTLRQAMTRLYLTVAALDAEAFRIQEGRWPSNPSELTKQVRDHPHFNSLRIKPLVNPDGSPSPVDGILVYSIGSDGIDHGGFARWELPFDHPQSNGPNESDDLGFRLVNPEDRGSLPATPPQP